LEARTQRLAPAQIAPVWLDREKTLEKVAEWVVKAAVPGRLGV